MGYVTLDTNGQFYFAYYRNWFLTKHWTKFSELKGEQYVTLESKFHLLL